MRICSGPTRNEIMSRRYRHSILYTLFAADDHWHERSKLFANSYPGKLILAACVIPEAAWLINKYLGARASICCRMPDGK